MYPKINTMMLFFGNLVKMGIGEKDTSPKID